MIALSVLFLFSPLSLYPCFICRPPLVPRLASPQLIIATTLTDDDVERFLGESTAAPVAPVAPAGGKKPAGGGGGKGAAAAAAAAAAAPAAAGSDKEFTVRFAATTPCEVPLAPLVAFFDGGSRDAAVATPREQMQALDIVIKTLFSGARVRGFLRGCKHRCSISIVHAISHAVLTKFLCFCHRQFRFSRQRVENHCFSPTP